MVSARPADDGPTFIVDGEGNKAAAVVFLNARRRLVHDRATGLEHRAASASLGINGAAAAGPTGRSNEIVA